MQAGNARGICPKDNFNLKKPSMWEILNETIECSNGGGGHALHYSTFSLIPLHISWSFDIKFTTSWSAHKMQPHTSSQINTLHESQTALSSSTSPLCETKLTTAVHTRSNAFTDNTLNWTGKNRKLQNCIGSSATLVTTLARYVERYTSRKLGKTYRRKECPSNRQ